MRTLDNYNGPFLLLLFRVICTGDAEQMFVLDNDIYRFTISLPGSMIYSQLNVHLLETHTGMDSHRNKHMKHTVV